MGLYAGISGTTQRMAPEDVKRTKTTIHDTHIFILGLTRMRNPLQTTPIVIKIMQTERHFYSKNNEASCCILQGSWENILYILEVPCYCNDCINGSDLCDGWGKHTVHSIEPHIVNTAEMQITERPAATLLKS